MLFFFIGCGRRVVEQDAEQYTFKYTSFEAKVIDYQRREKKDYLLLTGFKYVPKKSIEYNLDEFARFPKEALMEVENIEKYKNAESVECIGRFFIPIPSPKTGVKRINRPRGILKKCFVLKEKHKTFKTFTREKFRKYLYEEAANFSSAIFLSDTFAMSKEQRRVYEQAGLAHILGVSILNLTMVLVILFYFSYYFIGLLFLQSTTHLPLYVSAQLMSLFFIGFYCFLVGFEYPLLRGLFMSGISVYMLFFGKNNGLETLFLTAALMLFFYPAAVFDLGFQLSFGGVFGIFAFSHIRFKNPVLSLFWTTFSAMSVIGPLSIYQFQQVCLQPFLSNLLVLPFLSFVLIPSLLLYIILPDFLASFLSIFINFEFDFLLKMVVFLSKMAQNTHFLPVFYLYFLSFLFFFYFFAIFKEHIRYFFLGLAYFVFFVGIVRAYNFKPFILVNMSSIGLVLKDKIVIYPKCGTVGEVWSEYYNLPAVDGANSGYFKNDCEKIIVHGVGIIRKPPDGVYSLPTVKDYIFLPSDLMERTQIIYLE